MARQPQISTPLSALARPISRYDAKLLNAMAYSLAFLSNKDFTLPANIFQTSTVYKPKPYQLSKKESALYRELHDYIMSDTVDPAARVWNSGLTFPNSVTPLSDPFDDQTYSDQDFLKRLGKYETQLYWAFVEMLDMEGGFASPVLPR